MSSPDVDFWLFKIRFSESEQAIKYKIVFLNSVFLLAGLVAFGLAFIRIQTIPLLGVIDFAFAAANFALLVYLNRRKESVEVVASIALALSFALFFAIYLLAPYNQTRVSLFFLLSASAFFLKGRRVGRLWLAWIILSIVLAHFIPAFATGYSHFDVLTTCIYLFALFFIFENYETLKEDQYRRDQDQEVLRRTEERWRLALEGANDAVWDWDLLTGEIQYSTRFAEMLGYGEAELGHDREEVLKLLHPQDRPRIEADLSACLAGGADRLDLQYRMRTKDGGWKWVLCRGKVTRHDAAGHPVRMAGTHADVTDRKELEQRLMLQARTDFLTGLANRGYFLEVAAQELARVRRYRSPMSIAMLDLDGFKAINDTYGHEVGDRVLREFTKTCRGALRGTDVMGRVGGEEFAILFPETPGAKAFDVAERLREAVAAVSIPMAHGLPIRITVSLGVASFVESDVNIDVLLNRADQALYAAKRNGRNRTCEAGGTP